MGSAKAGRVGQQLGVGLPHLAHIAHLRYTGLEDVPLALDTVALEKRGRGMLNLISLGLER